ncbi:Cyclic nucleotide-gated ion channel 2 [Raphanus sativus]|nr:Cyclic nucleotide-gated ion channel 2 [Raphanus sativus]
MALAVDPLFFCAPSISRTTGPACYYIDGAFAAVVTVVRTCIDALHLWHTWLQFRLAPLTAPKSPWYLVAGSSFGILAPSRHTTHASSLASGYVLVSGAKREEKVKLIMTIILLIFLFRFLPKI